MIELFRGPNFYLSNMYPLENWIQTDQGIFVPTSEHAYQAAKFMDPRIHKLVAKTRKMIEDERIYADGLASQEIAGVCVEMGMDVRPDWEVAKRGIMLEIVRRKFIYNPDIAEKLMNTDDELIFEGNDWGDRYWGVDPIGSINGENQLGQIHMEVRSELQENPDQIIRT